VLGTAPIVFNTYFSVQVSIAINAWYGPFYDLIQQALAKTAAVTAAQLYTGMRGFAGITFLAVTVGVLNLFFVSHWIFRWRTAMNECYMANWPRLRQIEGASQRVQGDTMRFSTTMERLGVSLVSAVMTLIAFLSVLFKIALPRSINAGAVVLQVAAPPSDGRRTWRSPHCSFHGRLKGHQHEAFHPQHFRDLRSGPFWRRERSGCQRQAGGGRTGERARSGQGLGPGQAYRR